MNLRRRVSPALLSFALALAVLPATSALAAVATQYGGAFASWPADASWIPIASLNDPNDKLSKSHLDIVGDTTNPAVYHFVTDTYWYARVRMDYGGAVTTNSPFTDTVGVYLDYNRDGALDYGLVWDTKAKPTTAHGLGLQVPKDEGKSWSKTRLSDLDKDANKKVAPPDLGLTNGDGFVRTVTGVSTTNFGLTTYLDFAVKCSYLAANSKLRCTGQSWNIMVGTSDDSNSQNFVKYDVAGAASPATSPRPWSAPLDAAVDFLALKAVRQVAGVDLFWTTGSEIRCGAFKVLRCTLPGADCPLASHQELPGVSVACLNSGAGGDYEALDATALATEGYSYFIREYETTGATLEYGPVLLAVGQDESDWVAQADPETDSDGGCGTSPRGPNSFLFLAPLLALAFARRRTSPGRP